MFTSLPKLLVGLGAATLLLTGCAKDDDLDLSIAGVAVATADFQELEDAAIRGGVVTTLANKNPNDPQGNFTVFAPTNDAFARLGLRTAADLNALQQPFLTNTLLYHVANGLVTGDALQYGKTSASVLGPNRRFTFRGGSMYVNGSRILATDVKATNGRIHSIDKVLLATGADITSSAVALSTSQVFVKPELTYLVAALQLCKLTDALTKTPGSPAFTVFAPTDQAFKNLMQALALPVTTPAADVQSIANKVGGVDVLAKVLLNHVVAGANGDKFTSELPENASLTTLADSRLLMGPFANGLLTVKGTGNTAPAAMVIPDVQCTNGVVHVIDQVLLP
ncbi:fasciclin domain-containing protein [Hymenobacter persicinus]|uniref:Fasciclin domain-containing protein n=1 Tax=Hymenobacter persicinus TaxID=2025506 RepID=A0A4Q5L8K8_9BACT|nr:fasciclin domain-containing protein [Hymenobacter persicinus]RYU75447.1 fasciclin domain-containing protein [Hymenobacter persicinus]